jgi:hypothetical protein
MGQTDRGRQDLPHAFPTAATWERNVHVRARQRRTARSLAPARLGHEACRTDSSASLSKDTPMHRYSPFLYAKAIGMLLSGNGCARGKAAQP